jgi:hypothetical protein
MIIKHDYDQLTVACRPMDRNVLELVLDGSPTIPSSS